jgi:hypothetical protein
VIYVDSSVVLAQLFAEDRVPVPTLWQHDLISSRLLEYEIWTRVHALDRSSTHGSAAKAILEEFSFLELAPEVLTRALDPFPVPVRTLDAIHLATLEFLRVRYSDLSLACFDVHMADAARRLGVNLAEV